MDEELCNLTLTKIENILRSNSKSLRDFPMMPFPNMDNNDRERNTYTHNRLICDELRYDRRSLAEQHKILLSRLTNEQRVVYDKIMSAVQCGNGGIFFLYGYGGTGKNFVWNTLASGLRSKGQIVLTIVSSGIASLLLRGGRTAHSRFAIPLNLDEFSMCNIKQGSPLVDLIIKTKLIIWYEALMMNRYCFEALDRTMRDLLRFNNENSLNMPFRGKTIVFGGDFGQILPVIPKGSKQDIVNATINSSYLWNNCEILSLTQNMRLQSNCVDANTNQLKEFANWILKVGDGRVGMFNDGADKIEIPHDLLIQDWDDPIAVIVEATYTEYLNSLHDERHLEGRAILALTLHMVDVINEHMISLNSNDATTYLSSDAACRSDFNNDMLERIHTPEFFNSIKCSGVPNHELILKVGTPIMLLRNIDHRAGLCNGTRLVITRLGKHIIEAKVITGNNIGKKKFHTKNDTNSIRFQTTIQVSEKTVSYHGVLWNDY